MRIVQHIATRYTVLIGIAFLVLTACGSTKKADPNQRVYVGYYQQDYMIKITPGMFKNKSVLKPHVVAWAADFATEFPKDQIKGFQKMNIVPMISWEPRIWSDYTQSVSLQDIASGKWDRYLKSWAVQIQAVELPVLISFAPEFNSEAFPWGIPNNGRTGAAYIEAYRHVVTLFREEGVSNAIFVWTILPTSSPKVDWNNPLLYYPGDEYVDWIGLAAVNQQSSLKVMFGDMVSNLSANHPDKPVMITRYYFEPSKALNEEVVEDLQLELPSIRALVFSNPKTLKIGTEFFNQQLFQASIDEFAYLHL